MAGWQSPRSAVWWLSQIVGRHRLHRIQTACLPVRFILVCGCESYPMSLPGNNLPVRGPLQADTVPAAIGGGAPDANRLGAGGPTASARGNVKRDQLPQSGQITRMGAARGTPATASRGENRRLRGGEGGLSCCLAGGAGAGRCGDGDSRGLGLPAGQALAARVARLRVLSIREPYVGARPRSRLSGELPRRGRREQTPQLKAELPVTAGRRAWGRARPGSGARRRASAAGAARACGPAAPAPR